MKSHRATGARVEQEIERRINAIVGQLNVSPNADPFELGRGVGAAESLRALRKWIVEELYAHDDADADSDGTLRRPAPPEGETRRREAAGE